jgi:rare lipoprotein A
MHIFKVGLLAIIVFWLASCGGVKTQPTPPAPSIAKSPQVSTPDTNQAQNEHKPSNKGGYYLDDGPDDNPPSEINNIPNAVPKNEPYLTRSNKPYEALGQRYVPMTSYRPYKKQGIATWYGKRYHGRNTSSGEVYDMHGMTAAHPILPIPSYVKVTNVNNGASVIVRVNDRGPFKHDRLIDLSYVAAHKLGIVANGSGKVEVELIDTRNMNATSANVIPVAVTQTNSQAIANASNSNTTQQFFVQAGAFKSELNASQLKQTIQTQNMASISSGQNITITNVYNNGFYKVRLGPYSSQQAADLAASEIRKTHNLSALVVKD